MPNEQLRTPLTLVTEKAWPQQTLAKVLTRSSQQSQFHLAGWLAEDVHTWWVNSLGSRGIVSYYSPTSLCFSSPCCHLLLFLPHSFISLFGHFSNMSGHPWEQTWLKEGSEPMCDILRFSHMDRAGVECATWEERMPWMGKLMIHSPHSQGEAYRIFVVWNTTSHETKHFTDISCFSWAPLHIRDQIMPDRFSQKKRGEIWSLDSRHGSTWLIPSEVSAVITVFTWVLRFKNLWWEKDPSSKRLKL